MTCSTRKEEHQLLEKICMKAPRRRAAEKAGIPQVGIVFLYNGKIFIDATPVTEAESYAHFKIHRSDHYQYWEQLSCMRAVPIEVGYDEVPRGRAVYDTKTRKFKLFLDGCILRNKKAVSRIMAQMGLLSANTETCTDSHYRCPKCLRKNRAGNWI